MEPRKCCTRNKQFYRVEDHNMGGEQPHRMVNYMISTALCCTKKSGTAFLACREKVDFNYNFLVDKMLHIRQSDTSIIKSWNQPLLPKDQMLIIKKFQTSLVLTVTYGNLITGGNRNKNISLSHVGDSLFWLTPQTEWFQIS